MSTSEKRPGRVRTGFRWFIFIAMLAGVGMALHVILPPSPRWTITVTAQPDLDSSNVPPMTSRATSRGPECHGVVSADGATLVTCTVRGEALASFWGPLQTWDTVSGECR